MSDGLFITSDAAKLMKEFADLPKHLQEAVRKGLKRALLLIEDAVRRRADVKFAGSRAGLSSRLTSYVEVGGALAIDGVIGFRKTAHFPYEMSQEFGAKAAPGKAMVVPVSAKAKALSARGQGPRDMAGVTLFIPKGTHVLAEQKNLKSFRRGGHILEIHYILIKSLRPRLHFRENVIDNLDIVGREIISGVKEALAS